MVVESARAGDMEHLKEDRLKIIKNTGNIWNALQKYKSVETETPLPAIQTMGIAARELRDSRLPLTQATFSTSLPSRSLSEAQWLTQFGAQLSLRSCLNMLHASK